MEKKPNMQMPTAADLDHLRLLSIFHYVLAAIMACAALVPLIHLAVGILLVSGVIEPPEEEAEIVLGIVGVMFIVIPLLLILSGLTLSALVAIAGRQLARHTNYTYCMVMAAVACIFFPIGTVLGVFTLLVLMRPGVREMFEA